MLAVERGVLVYMMVYVVLGLLLLLHAVKAVLVYVFNCSYLIVKSVKEISVESYRVKLNVIYVVPLQV